MKKQNLNISSVKAFGVVALTTIILGGAGGLFLGLRWNTSLDGAHIANFLGRFFTSAGLGGVATIAAALLAISGVMRQINHSAAAAESTRIREIEEYGDAEWWKSFEWTTARVFTKSGADQAIEDEFAYSLASALRLRARTDDQKATCDALVNQVSAIPVPATFTTDAEAAVMQSLASYLRRAPESGERDDMQNLNSARKRLFDLQIRGALRALEADGAISELTIDARNPRDDAPQFNINSQIVEIHALWSSNPRGPEAHFRFVMDPRRNGRKINTSAVTPSTLFLGCSVVPIRPRFLDWCADNGLQMIETPTDFMKMSEWLYEKLPHELQKRFPNDVGRSDPLQVAAEL